MPFMEEQIFFLSRKWRIEGLLHVQPGQKAVVTTHPHPLFGGTMHSDVVEAVLRAYAEKGYTTLRFNFRGTGASEGTHENGVGEQEDVKAALGFLRERGKSEIDLAGYSFGSWVNAQALCDSNEVRRMIMVSPAVQVLDFSFVHRCPQLKLVITGSRDDLAPSNLIANALPRWNGEAELRIIEGADHFYRGQTDAIENIISAFLEDQDQATSASSSP